MALQRFTVRITPDDDGSLVAEVLELPGCIASGFDWEELAEALTETMSMYLSSSTVEAVVSELSLDQLQLFDDDSERPLPAELELAIA